MPAGLVRFGSGDASTIVNGPDPGRLNEIVSRPGVALALVIAWRSDPAPESATLVTVNVCAAAGEATTPAAIPATTIANPTRSANRLVRRSTPPIRPK